MALMMTARVELSLLTRKIELKLFKSLLVLLDDHLQ